LPIQILMKDSLNNIHPSFKLNGISYSAVELKEMAYSLVKEGLDHEIDIGDFLLDWLFNSRTLLVSTSGSTGDPKIIELQKIHMQNSAKETAKFLGLQPGNTALLCLPVKYIAGKMMLVRAMVLGLEVYYNVPSSSPLKGIGKKFDFCAMVPMQLKNSLGEIERISKVIVGGAPVPESLKAMIREKSNLIYETFGMTETITHIALRKLSGGMAEKNFKILNNIVIATDNRNCLLVKAPELGAKEVQTNDVITMDSATEFRWMGRLDNIINSGGIKLHPEKIEEKLDSLIDGQFFMAGVPDESLGEKLVLILEGNQDVNKISTMIDRLEDLQKFEVPKAIYSLPDFVMTSSGKINRKETIKGIR